MSKFEKIVRFISDIEDKTVTLQNIVFVATSLFITFATGNYALRLAASYFFVILSLFFVILCVFKKYYNINNTIPKFLLFIEFAEYFGFLIISCVLLFFASNNYKLNKSFRKNMIHEKMLPDGLFYYYQLNSLDMFLKSNKRKVIIKYFMTINDIYCKCKDVLCVLNVKENNREDTLIVSFEELLAALGETKIDNTTLCDILSKQLVLLVNKNDKYKKIYAKMIDKIKVYKQKRKYHGLND